MFNGHVMLVDVVYLQKVKTRGMYVEFYHCFVNLLLFNHVGLLCHVTFVLSVIV